MSIKCKDIISLIEEKAPSQLAFKNDNIGLLIGNENSLIDSVLVALDISDDIIDEAVNNSVKLIITHHPFIFTPLKTINSQDSKGRMIHKLISNNINVYCAHTNLDASDTGINDYLAKLLNLIDVSILKNVNEEVCCDVYSLKNKYKKYGYGRIGYLESSISLNELCAKVKSALNVNFVDVVGKIETKVRKIAVCGGDGSDFIETAYRAGCDVYITGDVRYHDACDARDMGLSIINAGHFATEFVYMAELTKYLKDKITTINNKTNIILSSKNINPYSRV